MIDLTIPENRMRVILSLVGEMESVTTDDEDGDIYVDNLITEYLQEWSELHRQLLAS